MIIVKADLINPNWNIPSFYAYHPVKQGDTSVQAQRALRNQRPATKVADRLSTNEISHFHSTLQSRTMLR